MEKCIGIIKNTYLEQAFGDLCKSRDVYMLPFAGRYRLVDGIISNMVNSGIKTVGIYTGHNLRSTMDHLGDGESWDLDLRFKGLFLFTPTPMPTSFAKFGDIADFYSTLDFFEKKSAEHVFINGCNVITKVDLKDAYDKYIESDSDITLIYKEVEDKKAELINREKLHLDEDGNFVNIGLNLGTENKFNMFLDMVFIKKSVLLTLIKESVEKGDAFSINDAILLNKHRFKINTYAYDGFMENIVDISSYYEANLNLLNREQYYELFHKGGKIRTKTKDEPPTIYNDFPNVTNSLIANGCVIEGEVENSIIFRGVHIGKNATVKNSIVMQKSVIGEDGIVINSILDKFSEVEKGAHLVGSFSQPYVLGKNKVVRKD